MIDPRAAGDFASAIGERDVALLSGRLIAPTMAIVPAWECQDVPVAETVGSEAAARTLHAEHSFEFIAPLRPGVALTARSRLVEVAIRASGCFVSVATDISDATAVVDRQRYVVFAAGAVPRTDPARSSQGETVPPAHSRVAAAMSEIMSGGSVDERVDQGWATRYAEASGDHFEVHLDRRYAASLGFPGTILHGMCTLAIAARAVREVTGLLSTDSFLRLGARFTAPVFMPAHLRTDVEIAPSSGATASGRFSTHDVDRGNGRAVARNVRGQAPLRATTRRHSRGISDSSRRTGPG